MKFCFSEKNSFNFHDLVKFKSKQEKKDLNRLKKDVCNTILNIEIKYTYYYHHILEWNYWPQNIIQEW